jgi:hypothetical protein
MRRGRGAAAERSETDQQNIERPRDDITLAVERRSGPFQVFCGQARDGLREHHEGFAADLEHGIKVLDRFRSGGDGDKRNNRACSEIRQKVRLHIENVATQTGNGIQIKPRHSKLAEFGER